MNIASALDTSYGYVFRFFNNKISLPRPQFLKNLCGYLETNYCDISNVFFGVDKDCKGNKTSILGIDIANSVDFNLQNIRALKISESLSWGHFLVGTTVFISIKKNVKPKDWVLIENPVRLAYVLESKKYQLKNLEQITNPAIIGVII